MMQLGSRPPFISQDPPTQTEQRKTVRPSVAPRNLAKLEPLIRERTQQVLDGLPEGESFDWVDTRIDRAHHADAGHPVRLPAAGPPQAHPLVGHRVRHPEPGGIVESGQQKRDELLECLAYFTDLWELRRKNPGDDLISMLAHGEATKHMSAADHLGNVLLLIVGGNDTTRNTMSGSVYSLTHRFPEQFEKLRRQPGPHAQHGVRGDPLADAAPVHAADGHPRHRAPRSPDPEARPAAACGTSRATATRTSSTNGDVLDIERPNASRHLSFGYGIHFCMGSRLAEMQLRVLWVTRK